MLHVHFRLVTILLAATSAPSLLIAQDKISGAVESARQDIGPIQRMDRNSVLAHQQLIDKSKQGKIDVYFVGDSITRRWGATDYPRFLAHWKESFHGWNAANFGWGGDTTNNILWRMLNGEIDGISPKVIVLQAGTNNLPSVGTTSSLQVNEIIASMRSIMDVFQKKAPNATLVLTGIFPRTQNLDLRPTIEQINAQLATFADGKKIRFLNINEKLADADGRFLEGMSLDGLHLEQKGYEVWSRALKPIFTEILGPPASDDQAPPPTGDPSATDLNRRR